MSVCKIIVCSHKDVQIPKHPYFLPIQAGTALHDHIPGYVSDATGENISGRNPNWCELTCHYWAWKNLKSVDIIGLNHYRRYFDFDRRYPFFSPDRSFCTTNDFLSRDYHFPDLEGILSKYDIILPKTRHYPYSCTEQYGRWHISEHWDILRQVISEHYPEYIPAFERSMDKRNGYSGYNMFVSRWKWFDVYSKWLFDILFEVEKRIEIPDDPIQSRVFGYMSERLVNVFCEHHHLKIKHIPLIMPIDDNFINPSNIRYSCWRLRDDVRFNINH